MIFEDADAIPTLHELSQELVQGLPEELSDPYTLNRPWTKAVTDRLSEMGQRRNMLVFCHGSPNCEWLLDVIWMVAKEHKIVLAVESEWGNLAQVEDDFDKLLCIKARRKLLLFNTSNHTGAELFVNKLESNMRAYPHHLAGEEYMLLEVTAPGAFRYHFQVPSDGRLRSVSFSPIAEPLPWPWSPRRGATMHH
jgi:hypothetical protein